MDKDISIIDRGRGWQLSTSRITIQDLVPYFQQGLSHQEITRWIPSLTEDEIAVAEKYYRAHQHELDEQDRLIRARTEERIRQQRLRFPEREESHDQRMARLRQLLEKHRLEKNSEGHPR